jgi:acylaminoacyl-peptidase
MSEGIQMHQALVRFGVPSKLCLFADENHELSRSGKPKGRIGRLEEMLNWFEQYLK